MDKHQYQPPRTVYSEELYSQIEQNTLQSPERLKAPFQFIKDIEALVDSFRETAEALEQRDGRTIRVKNLPVTFWRPARSHEEILREQMNAERALTPPLFLEKNKYCVHYGAKVATPYSTPEVGHWYIEEMLDGRPGTGPVTHIETHPQYIKKFNSAGRREHVTISDLQVLISLTYHYVDTVLALYPFDRDRADVILDGIAIPDNIAALLPPEHREPGQFDYRPAA